MVNVYIPWQGDIPQTDLRLAYDQIEKNLDQLPKEKDAKILVYCQTSGMAKKAAATLLKSRLYQFVDAGRRHHCVGGSGALIAAPAIRVRGSAEETRAKIALVSFPFIFAFRAACVYGYLLDNIQRSDHARL